MDLKDIQLEIWDKLQREADITIKKQLAIAYEAITYSRELNDGYYKITSLEDFKSGN